MHHAESTPAQAQEGFTLIEVIITIALISIAFVGILSAVGGLVMSGVENKNASAVQAALRNAATFTQSFDSAAYVSCSQTTPTPKQAYQGDLAGAAVPAGLHRNHRRCPVLERRHTGIVHARWMPRRRRSRPGAREGDGVDVRTQLGGRSRNRSPC